MTIKDGRTDATLGGVTHVVFEGENDVIDRRAVVFSGEKKKKDRDDDADKPKDAPEKKQLTPDDPAYWQGGPTNDGREQGKGRTEARLRLPRGRERQGTSGSRTRGLWPWRSRGAMAHRRRPRAS